MKDVNELLKHALAETSFIMSGEEFLVKDLFKGYEWNRIPLKNRLLLGTLFLNCVNSEAEKMNIKVIEKTSSSQQKYRKI